MPGVAAMSAGAASQPQWPDRRPTTATRKAFSATDARKAKYSYYEQWEEKPDVYTSFHRSDYQRYTPQPALRRPEFSMGKTMDTGMGSVSKKIGLEELKTLPVPYSLSRAHDPERLRTTSATAFTAPDLLRAKLEPRSGVLVESDLAPGYSRTSAGLLPGKTQPGARMAPDSSTSRSELRRHHPMPARPQPSFTLSWEPNAGQPGYSVVVPPTELNKAHFHIGTERLDYGTASRAVHTQQVPGTGQQALPPFGALVQVGDKGTEFNIVHGGKPYKPSRYYEPSLPAQYRNSFRPAEPLPRGQRYNTITGELQNWLYSARNAGAPPPGSLSPRADP